MTDRSQSRNTSSITAGMTAVASTFRPTPRSEPHLTRPCACRFPRGEVAIARRVSLARRDPCASNGLLTGSNCQRVICAAQSAGSTTLREENSARSVGNALCRSARNAAMSQVRPQNSAARAAYCLRGRPQPQRPPFLHRFTTRPPVSPSAFLPSMRQWRPGGRLPANARP